MRFSLSTASAVAALAGSLFAPAVNAISTKEISGRYFVDSDTGEPFFLKGVDYQPGGSSTFEEGTDPLAETEACARDIYLFEQLGVNTIRVYSVDPSLDHDVCMTLLAEAGIYLVLDVNTPVYGQYLNRDEPWTTYTKSYLTHVFSVMEAFSGYNNTLGFFAGNEIVNNVTSAYASPNYIKAVVRDMKQYAANHLNRAVPIGYSAADDTRYRTSLAAYLESGPEEDAVDFYGINSYSWCGTQTIESSGYDVLIDDYSNFSLPIFFSEFGCNEVTPRTFQEVTALFSDEMTIIFSGGLAYEFTQETSDYGLVTIYSGNGTALELTDYDTLQTRYAAVVNNSYATSTAPARPTTYNTTYDNISSNTTLPNTLAADVIADGLNSSYVRGAFVETTITTTNYTIMDSDYTVLTDTEIEIVDELVISDESATEQTDNVTSTATSSSSSASSTSSSSGSSSSSSSTTSSSSSSTTSSTSAANALSVFKDATVCIAVVVALLTAIIV
ncbi:Glucanosyltransferase-domain-containing protein [Limtongia smithiae]|uniref:Glucanosyltransferase-domain-containing protein n=1 Tax=Limtongia smithiae TaxID=1125753 RepID=UPI0034CF5A5A